MSQVRIMVDVPESLAGESVERLSRRATLLLVIDEVRAGRLTRPAGARLLDMALDDFLIEAGRHGLYAIDYDEDDFSQELAEIAASGR